MNRLVAFAPAFIVPDGPRLQTPSVWYCAAIFFHDLCAKPDRLILIDAKKVTRASMICGMESVGFSTPAC
jgi:hypothetical protein